MDKDLYGILGVDKNANANTIKKAYRKQAMKYHPDKNAGDKEAETKFKDIAEAYEILSDPDKKARYDQLGYGAFTQGGQKQRGGFGFGFEDMEDVFNQMRQQQREEKTRRQYTKNYRLRLTMEEVYNGVTKTVRYKKYDKCDTCNGTGGEGVKKCTNCNGSGYTSRVTRQGNMVFEERQPCNTCGGKGFIISDPCKTCHGDGVILVEHEEEIEIPHSVKTGQQLLIMGGGSYYKSGKTDMYGDLIITIEVIYDKFQPTGENSLISKIKIDYPTLVLGGVVQFTTIDGSTHNVTIKEKTDVGKILRLKGKGLKFPNYEVLRGDQLLQVLVGAGLDNYIDTKIIVNDDQSQLFQVKKETPANVYAYGYHLKIIVNESIFEGLPEAYKILATQEALAGTHWDTENDKLIVSTPQKVHRCFIDKHGWDVYERLDESVKSLYDEKKNRATVEPEPINQD
jgi:molecular chaperone DnaJ